MPTKRHLLWIFALTLPLISCGGSKDNTINVTILHFNDIYEITAISGGKQGGLARVATLRKQLLAKNPNTITMLGGDLFSPSAMGTAVVGGERLAGRQMVDVLNQLGLDYATFGNHEFDINEEQFEQRMQEVEFNWVSSNAFNAAGEPYPGVNKQLLIPFTDPGSGHTFTLGLFGVTLTVNQPNYVTYSDPFKAATEQVNELKDKADLVVALTHQAIEDDVAMIEQNREIGLVLGGHEHINYQRWRGNFTPLLKGDANVRSVYVVELSFNPTTGKTTISPSLVPIDDTIEEDPSLKQVVDKWASIVFDAFREQGFQPEETVTTTTSSLDGLESSVRSSQTDLTKLIAESMLLPYPQADLSIYNSGSIRIDDTLPPGKVSQYDIIRILPFGGHVQLIEISGELLKKALDQGMANTGTGGYLQSANTQYKNNGWLIKQQPIDISKKYLIAIADFLTTGRERGLEFLASNSPGITMINKGEDNDIRQSLIEKMKTDTN